MRTGCLRYGVGLGALALLLVPALRAQNAPTPPPGLEPLPKVSLPPRTTAIEPAGAIAVPAPEGMAKPENGEAHPLEHHVDDHPPASGEEEGFSFHGLYFTGDYLLLRPRRDALDYAVISSNKTETPGGSVESLHWNTDSGFRFGAGYWFPGKDWAISVTYTYDHSHDTRSLAAPDGGALYATLTRAGGYDQVGRADAYSNFDYNVIDIDLKHKLKVQETLDMTVFAGGRFAWIDQQLGAVYNGGPDNALNDKVLSPVYFRGGGLTVGSEGVWNFWNGLGIYGKARGSLVSGEFRNFLKETTNNGSVSVVNISEKYNQIVPVAELGLGVAYTGDHWHFSVGYELSNWFNMVNSVDFSDSSNIGKVGRRTSDLSLEGLAVQLGLVF